MLSNIAIRNYQSLGDISLDLQPFTVIVGPSSSGKSAFTRALKCLTGNQRGDSFITHGQTQTVIKAKTDRGTVALLRGKKNEYVLIPDDDVSQQQSFTKLSGTTPEEVSAFIGIPSRDPLNYSNQFDMPYLLTSSAAEVARTLGELTNVSVIFEASREANRRRLQASNTLKIRAADYATLTADIDKYRGLKETGEKISNAEAVLAEAQECQTRIHGLNKSVATLMMLPEAPAARSVPSADEAVALSNKIHRLRTLALAAVTAREDVLKAEEEAEDFAYRTTAAEGDYLAALRELGTCPTCGQDTGRLHAH